MNEEKDLLQKTENRHYKLKMTFSIIILTTLFIVELYLIMNYPGGYLAIGFVALGMLCFVYLITDIAFKMKAEKEALYKQEYESVFKAEKVSYISMKQNFMEIQDTLEKIQENCDFPVEELIRTQKGVAKVTIQRSKENAEAIMNCNDQLLDRMVSLEERLKEINQAMDRRQDDEAKKLSEEIIAKQQEIISYVNKMEDVVKKEITGLSSYLIEQIRQEIKDIPVMTATTEPTEMSTEELERILAESSAMMSSLDMEIPGIPNVLDNEISDNPVGEKEIVNPEETVIPDEIVIPDEPVMPEEIAVPDEPVMPEEVVIADEPVMPEEVVIPDEPVMPEEVVIPDEPVMPEEVVIPDESVMPEEVTIPDESVVPEPIVPPSSDPNHIMTPEEIATLLGEVSAVMEEPEPEPEPVVEEKPPMPDLSNPNHIMTPEEIAALLANM